MDGPDPCPTTAEDQTDLDPSRLPPKLEYATGVPDPFHVVRIGNPCIAVTGPELHGYRGSSLLISLV